MKKFYCIKPCVSRLYFLKVFLGGVRRLFCKHRVIEFRNIRHFDLDTYCAKCGKQL